MVVVVVMRSRGLSLLDRRRLIQNLNRAVLAYCRRRRGGGRPMNLTRWRRWGFRRVNFNWIRVGHLRWGCPGLVPCRGNRHLRCPNLQLCGGRVAPPDVVVLTVLNR